MLTTEKILENNKLIAEFMETPFIIEGRVPFLYSDEEPFPYTERDFNLELIKDEVWSEIEAFGNTLNIYIYSYHSSWDWLMPVVKKCTDSVKEFEFDTEEYEYWSEELFHPDYMLSEFINNDIDSIYNRVVEFIKWYNTQNK